MIFLVKLALVAAFFVAMMIPGRVAAAGARGEPPERHAAAYAAGHRIGTWIFIAVETLIVLTMWALTGFSFPGEY